MVGSKRFSKKVCPSCNFQCPVACKKCTCGFKFHAFKSDSPIQVTSEGDSPVKIEANGLEGRAGPSGSTIRRTERVRRERPNFYDASEFISEKKLRKQLQDQEEKELRAQQRSPQKSKKKRGRKPKLDKSEPVLAGPAPGEIYVGPFGKIYPIDDEPLPAITEEKQWQFSVILEDLSRKLISNNPKF